MTDIIYTGSEKSIVRNNGKILRLHLTGESNQGHIVREIEDGEMPDLPGKYGPPALYTPGIDQQFNVAGWCQVTSGPILCTFNASTQQWEGGPQDNDGGPGWQSYAYISLGGPGIGGIYWWFAHTVDSTFYGPSGSWGYKYFGLWPCGSSADYGGGITVSLRP